MRHHPVHRELMRRGEAVLDGLYHPLDLSRTDIDFEIGMVRGAALVLAALRHDDGGGYLGAEISRSLERLKAIEDAS